MYIFKVLFVSFFFVSLNGILLADIYEDGEDKTIKRWHVLQSYSSGVVKNIYDKGRKSRVLKFDGDSTKSAYLLRLKKDIIEPNMGNKIFHWDMKYSEDFVIMIGLNTIKGKRYLLYTPGDENSYLQYGLGKDTKLEQWKHYSRNLEEDLRRFDASNRIINLNNFVIKGSGLLDNIKMVANSNSKPNKKLEKKIEKVISKIKKPKKEPKEVQAEKNENSIPTIYMNGKNPLVLKKGQAYIEAGATARDTDGSEVVVSISEDIDIFHEGEYSVIYMATNRAGNSVVDSRRIIVGNVKEDKAQNSKRNNEKDEEEEATFEQRVMEVAEWEKELARRENELARKESMKEAEHHYPSRPGL